MTAEELYNLPQDQNILLSTIEKLGIIKAQTAKNLIHRGELVAIKIGQRFYVPRKELIRFIEASLTTSSDI